MNPPFSILSITIVHTYNEQENKKPIKISHSITVSAIKTIYDVFTSDNTVLRKEVKGIDRPNYEKFT